jgi:hypothetical protein
MCIEYYGKKLIQYATAALPGKNEAAEAIRDNGE